MDILETPQLMLPAPPKSESSVWPKTIPQDSVYWKIYSKNVVSLDEILELPTGEESVPDLPQALNAYLEFSGTTQVEIEKSNGKSIGDASLVSHVANHSGPYSSKKSEWNYENRMHAPVSLSTIFAFANCARVVDSETGKATKQIRPTSGRIPILLYDRGSRRLHLPFKKGISDEEIVNHFVIQYFGGSKKRINDFWRLIGRRYNQLTIENGHSKYKLKHNHPSRGLVDSERRQIVHAGGNMRYGHYSSWYFGENCLDLVPMFLCPFVDVFDRENLLDAVKNHREKLADAVRRKQEWFREQGQLKSISQIK